ncbi:hypothetical protein R5R35_006035 [Gryllus longicercus]|uniref:UDP-D-xylose:beta-D-glucoside alpha-1,3-D-xylosyltransferase n=1 Tax=Gryllus longicercus TaxID=2509291 RepID=A0AAN9VRK7_9ORTH
MKTLPRVFLFTILCVVFLYIIITYLLQDKHESPHSYNKIISDNSRVLGKISNANNLKITSESSLSVLETHPSPFNSKLHKIVLAVVACGDRLAETLVMIKSAIIFTSSDLVVIVFSDKKLIPSFKEKLNEWRTITNQSFSYEVYPVTFPPEENAEEWRALFKPCASQRLFLPVILKHVDSLLYVDTDTLFLGPVENVWRHFEKMNSSQIAALAPEHEDPNTGWYNRFARHPYYGKLGVNSGVMLMNLTRMRAFQWTAYVIPIYKEYKLKITWGDQDIINIIFHFHPEKLYIYPCRYNYRPDHCMYMNVCKSANDEGVAVLHGSRGSFHAIKQPPFHAIYKAMEEYQLGTDLYMNLYMPMKNYLDLTSSSNCGKVRHIFTKSVEKIIQKVDL